MESDGGTTSASTDSCSLKGWDKTTCTEVLFSLKNLRNEDIALIRKRTGVNNLSVICSHHHKNILELYASRQTKCCDPYNKHGTPARADLREITMDLAVQSEEFLNLIPGMKLCSNCRKSLRKQLQELQMQALTKAIPAIEQCSEETETQEGLDSQNSAKSDEIFPTPPDIALANINQALAATSQSPILSRKSLRSGKFVQEKLDKLNESISKKIVKAGGGKSTVTSQEIPESYSSQDALYFRETLLQLKKEFSRTNDRNRHLQILSVLPLSFPIINIIQEFGVTRYFALLAKRLTREKGVLPQLQSRKRRILSESVTAKVRDFYYDDLNSRELPGSKDFVSVKEGEMKIKKQKRLVLCNLKEIYVKYKEEEKHEDFQIGFSKFCELRPKECVLAGATGTHTVCVCVYHQNFKLMVDAAGLEEINEDGTIKCLKYQEILRKCICDDPSEKCYVGRCNHCPGTSVVEEMMQVDFDLYEAEQIKVRQWTKTDGCQLERMILPKEEFIQKFLTQIPVVLERDFLAKEQGWFLKKKKEELLEEECIIIGDFSENYTPCWQDAVQSVHWSDVQVTLHPFIIYYKAHGKLEHLNYLVVSDDKEHKNEQVFSFQQKLIPYLKIKINGLKKIYYFSDGAKSQYKNRKNVQNLRHHVSDFGLSAEWHYFATAHGKGPCDGLAGSAKRLARRESLHNKLITNPKEFFNWAKKKYEKKYEVVFVSKEEINSICSPYQERFSEAPEVQGISAAHAVIPVSQNVVILKKYSKSDCSLFTYFGALEEVNSKDLHGFIIVNQDNTWTVALVQENFEDNQKVQVSLLERDGSPQSLFYKFPEMPILLTLSIENVIAIVNVEVLDDGMYKIKKAHKSFADKITMGSGTSSSSRDSHSKTKRRRKEPVQGGLEFCHEPNQRPGCSKDRSEKRKKKV